MGPSQNYHHRLQNSFILPQNSLCSYTLGPQQLATTTWLSTAIVPSFWECLINGILHTIFWDGLILLTQGLWDSSCCVCKQLGPICYWVVVQGTDEPVCLFTCWKAFGLFPFLAIANEAAIRIDVHILVATGFHFCRVSTRKLGHWVVWQVNVDVYETAKLSSQVAVLFSIPCNNVGAFQFFTSSTVLGMVSILNFSNFHRSLWF